MKKLFLFGILLLVMLSVAFVGVRAITGEKGTCVIGPNRGSNAESLGQGVENQASGVCDAGTEGCGACLEQCAPYKKIKDLYGCIEGADQVNVVQPSISYGCGYPPGGLGSLFQSFTPSVSPLTAVDLRLRAGGNLSKIVGYNTTINIRSNTPNGSILETATTFVPALASGTQLMVNFELPEIEVTPGGTYIIEWISPEEGGVILTWMGAGNDTYPGGTAFGCTGTAYNNDFIFITYTTT